MYDDKNEIRPRFGRSSVLRGESAVKQLKVGVDLAVSTIGATMGPMGKCVIIAGEEGASPVVTKDGVTVSKAIDPVHPVERMGAQLVREAASRTNDEAGDGTTTASVLTGALVDKVVKLIAAGYNTASVKSGMQDATEHVLQKLAESVEKIETEEELRDIAKISANGDSKIGDLVAAAVHKTGVDGVVAVENARSSATTLEIVEGLRFDRGYLSPYFVNDQERMRIEYENCRILITDKKLSSLKELIPVLEGVARNKVPLIIIAEDIDGDAMQGLVLNRVNSQLQVAAVKLPGIGMDRDAQMQDLISLVGGTHPTSSSGVKVDSLTLESLGTAKKVVIDSKFTTIVAKPEAEIRVKNRIEELRSQLDDVSLTFEDTEMLKRRLAKLASGAAIVRVGGNTEIELNEKKYRIEDALHAARAALEEGVVPGGGLALLRASRNISEPDAHDRDYVAGYKALIESCEAPIRKIASNAGQSPDVVVEKCLNEKDDHVGWDARSGSMKNLRKEGVIDPAKVTRCALQNAVSVAIIFLQLDSVVHEPIVEKENNK